MKKIIYIISLVLISFCLYGQQQQVYAPNYNKDRLKFSSQEVDNLTLRRLTPWTTGEYCIAVYDVMKGTISYTTIIDERYKNKVVDGIIGSLTASATIYFYGYGTSFVLSTNGNDIIWRCSWMKGEQRLSDGYGIGDNFEIPVSSPTWIAVDLLNGATVNYYIRGLK